MFVITAQRPGESAAIEALLDDAFGADRHRKTAYRYRIRTRAVPGLSLVAREPAEDGESVLVGSIRYWPVDIAPATPALLLGPLAVAPGRSGEGIGRTLIRRSLALAKTQGHHIVLLVGPLDYYGQFGFHPASRHGIAMPGEAPERLLAAELTMGALTGVSGQLVARNRVVGRRFRDSEMPGEDTADLAI